MTAEQLVALQRFDDPTCWEYPPGFDYASAVARFRRFAEELTSCLSVPIGVETEAHVQDASFHGQLFIPAPEGGSIVVRFSNFGDMVTFSEEEPVPEQVSRTLKSLFQKHRYVYIPAEVLNAPYTGQNKGVTGIRDWRIRYFDWV